MLDTTDWITALKLSVLAPVYNEATYIRSMIDSIQNQTHLDWELLLVDDGSTDSTAEIVSAMAAIDRRIRLLSSGVKLGKVPAYNMAIRHASGELIMMLGGDDMLTNNSLSIRVNAFEGVDLSRPAAAFFKLRTLSDDPTRDGVLIPKGDRVNRSAGTTVINRRLADLVFPIDESLVAEDIWIQHLSLDKAVTVIDRPEVVLLYRIHAGNSNPRGRSFGEMNEAMHARHQAWRALLDEPRLDLTAEGRAKLGAMCVAESYRYTQRPISLLIRTKIRLIDRIALMSMASPLLFKLRMRFFAFFSGRR